MGTPSDSAMKTSCEGARAHVRRTAHKPPSLAALYTLSNQATHEAVHLLCRMLVFDPVSILGGDTYRRVFVYLYKKFLWFHIL